jgi:cytochrome b
VYFFEHFDIDVQKNNLAGNHKDCHNPVGATLVVALFEINYLKIYSLSSQFIPNT